MKLPRSTLIWCVLIVCLTLLIFTYLTPEITLRNPVQGHEQGGGGFHGLRVRQEVVQHIVLIGIYTKPTIPLVVAYRGRQNWQRLCLKPLEQCSLANIASVNRERN